MDRDEILYVSVSAISLALGYMLMDNRNSEEANEVTVSSFASGRGRVIVQNPI